MGHDSSPHTDRRMSVTSEYPERIWFYPPKFWAATRGMSQQQIDELKDKLTRMAEEKDFNGLRQFDFIYIGNPYKKQRAS